MWCFTARWLISPISRKATFRVTISDNGKRRFHSQESISSILECAEGAHSASRQQLGDLFCKSSTRLSPRDNNQSYFWTTTIFSHGIWRRTYHCIKARERCQLCDYSSWQQHFRGGTGRTCCTSCTEVLLGFAYKPKVSGAAEGLRGWRSDEAAQVCAKAKYQVMIGAMIQQH